jgi:hypothetical protein
MHHRGGPLRALVRGLFGLLILFLVLSFVLSFFGMRGWGMPWHMDGYGVTQSVTTTGMPGGMMGRWGFDKDDSRVFGVIKKIDGATITILDNANAERTVVSTGTTVIVDSTSELSLSDLIVGDRIGVTGTSDDKTITAKLIEVITN